MTKNIKNLLYLFIFATMTYLVGGQMKKWVESKEVVAFEFLKTEANTNALLNSKTWQTPDAKGYTKIERLRINTRIDFIYIICYVFTFVSLARVLLGEVTRKTKTMTLMLVMAGGADTLENICIFQILSGERNLYPAVMYGFAALKFGLLLLFLGWLIIATGQRLLQANA